MTYIAQCRVKVNVILGFPAPSLLKTWMISLQWAVLVFRVVYHTLMKLLEHVDVTTFGEVAILLSLKA